MGIVDNPLRVASLAPFVPSGKDYGSSRWLFAGLGFEAEWEGGDYSGVRSGNARFILQRFENEEFASNFMIRIDVPDLDAWWEGISKKELDKKYPGFRIAPPADFPWGREGTFIDLASVCWRIGSA